MKKWQDKEEFKKIFTEKAHVLWEKELRDLTLNEVYQTIAYMIRDLVSEDWIRTNEVYAEQKAKQVYYFSIEFLLGRLLQSNLIGIGLEDICRQGLEDLGWKLEDPRIIQAVEPYPGRWTNHVLLCREVEVDGELLDWLQEAWDFAQSKR